MCPIVFTIICTRLLQVELAPNEVIQRIQTLVRIYDFCDAIATSMSKRAILHFLDQISTSISNILLIQEA